MHLEGKFLILGSERKVTLPVKELLEKLHEVGEKANYLHQKTNLLAEENRNLRLRLLELETSSGEKDSEIRNLSAQLEIAKLAQGLGKGDLASSEEFKNKINDYIREIDQCLKLIGD